MGSTEKAYPKSCRLSDMSQGNFESGRQALCFPLDRPHPDLFPVYSGYFTFVLPLAKQKKSHGSLQPFPPPANCRTLCLCGALFCSTFTKLLYGPAFHLSSIVFLFTIWLFCFRFLFIFPISLLFRSGNLPFSSPSLSNRTNFLSLFSYFLFSSPSDDIMITITALSQPKKTGALRKRPG